MKDKYSMNWRKHHLFISDGKIKKEYENKRTEFLKGHSLLDASIRTKKEVTNSC